MTSQSSQSQSGGGAGGAVGDTGSTMVPLGRGPHSGMRSVGADAFLRGVEPADTTYGIATSHSSHVTVRSVSH